MLKRRSSGRKPCTDASLKGATLPLPGTIDPYDLANAQVDRLWAAWQTANAAKGGDAAVDNGNPGYPESHRGSLFVWPEVKASEMFDYKALGYQYDGLPSPK